MAFLSCEEMLAAARTQNISLAEAVLRSDLAESRLTEEQSRHGMRHLWHVMEATSRDYDPAQRSRSGLSGGDAAKVEQAHRAGRSYGGDYLAEVTAEALKTAECNACMKRIVAAPTAGSCGVLPAVLLPLAARAKPMRPPSAKRSTWPQASVRSLRPARRWPVPRAAARPRSEPPAPWLRRRSATSRAAHRNSVPQRPPWRWATCWAWSATRWRVWWKSPASSGMSLAQ